MNRSHRELRLAPIALAIGAVAIVFSVQAADRPDSEQVSNLLSQVKSHAFQMKEDAATLESYTRLGGVSWQTHASVITQMKERINEAGRDVQKLEDAKKSASPWQEMAIQRIQPLLRELATNTGKAIQYLNENPKRLSMDPYKSYLEANADVSEELSSMISDFVDYGNTKQRLEMLERRLELPASR